MKRGKTVESHVARTGQACTSQSALLRLNDEIQSLVLGHCDAAVLGRLEQVCTSFAPPPRPLSIVQRAIKDRMRSSTARLQLKACVQRRANWPALLRKEERTEAAVKAWDVHELDGKLDAIRRIIFEDQRMGEDFHYNLMECSNEAVAEGIRKVLDKLVYLKTQGRSSKGPLKKCVNFIEECTSIKDWVWMVDEAPNNGTLRRDLVVRAGGVAALLGILQQGPDTAKPNVARALANITESNEHCDVVVKAGGVAVLLGILEHGPDKAKPFAVSALANITWSDSNEHCDVVVNSTEVEIIRGVVNAGGVGALLKVLLHCKRRRDTKRFARALSVITQSQQHCDTVVNALVRVLLKGSSKSIPAYFIKFAVRALYNITTNKRRHAAVVRAGGVPALLEVLHHGKGSSKWCRAAASALHNITASPQHCDAVVNAGGVEILLEVLRHGHATAKVKSASALCYIIENNQHHAVVVSAGGVDALLQLVMLGMQTNHATLKACLVRMLMVLRNELKSDHANFQVEVVEGTEVERLQAAIRDGAPLPHDEAALPQPVCCTFIMQGSAPVKPPA